jgi:hypothetical protein
MPARKIACRARSNHGNRITIDVSAHAANTNEPSSACRRISVVSESDMPGTESVQSQLAVLMCSPDRRGYDVTAPAEDEVTIRTAEAEWNGYLAQRSAQMRLGSGAYESLY